MLQPDAPLGGLVHRRAARVLLLDGTDRLLLLHGTDPSDAALGDWWFTPGGGLDDGELPVQAARRELAEETGLVLPPEAFGEVVHDRVAEFSFGGTRYVQAEVFYLVRVDAHEVDTAGWTPLEVASVVGHRWWPLAEIGTTDERVYPGDLLAVVDRVLAGAGGRAPRT